ncbi:cell division protein ZapB [Mycolicibacterium fortuitum]|uniref:cell division protein ZapB n=1 Tax=Mycolicibacterium fortuitum TaxID=1766 RepID=UPI001CDC9502|nr:cell division protein ZapB [Mycolicibacterium fortuitum]UBV22734.1 cell division protein ZapB [Mycolicibacterium fortuitum]
MHDADNLADQLTLTPGELVALHALRLQMMRNDISQEHRDARRERKQLVFNEFHREFLVALRSSGTAAPSGSFGQDAAAQLAGAVSPRSRAMILLIDLMTFNPWYPSEKWVSAARQTALQEAVQQFAGVSQSDLDAATREFDALMRQLKRKSIKWGRVAAVSVVGLGIGAATAGWAAPAVGAAIGGSLGLSGAAATSAGLAMLGGGSIAAGGFGVFGGTILLTGAGGVFAAGAAGVTARFSRVGAAEVVADAIKLDLLAKLVLVESQDRDQKLRRVAEGLQSRINDFSENINLLSERIVALKAEVKRLGDENRALKAELSRLRDDRTEAENAKTTLAVVLDRLPAVAG